MSTPTRPRKGHAPSPGKRLLEEAWRATAPEVGPGRAPIGQMYGERPGSFYDGSTPDRTLAVCPDCGAPCDPVLADHVGGCIDAAPIALPGSALHLVRRLALGNVAVSRTELATEFRAAGVSRLRATDALNSAVRRRWVVRNLAGGFDSLIVGQRLEERPR